MAVDQDLLKEKLGIFNLKALFYDRVEFSVDNPNYFFPDGLCCFVGSQGSGKTLSAVNYVYNLMNEYPMAKLCTNIMLKDYPIITFKDFLYNNYPKMVWQNYEDLTEMMKENIYNDYLKLNRVFAFDGTDDLITYSNLNEGVIFLIDEIQLYLNSLESKSISINVMNEISQQRKQRKHIVCTSQVFGRLAKPLREQFNSVILCKKYFNCLQINSLISQDDIDFNADSMNVEGQVSKKYFWFHHPSMYKRYDTYYKIDRTKAISNATDESLTYEKNN